MVAIKSAVLLLCIALIATTAVASTNKRKKRSTGFNIDLQAAAPRSYSHSTGGGASNDRTVGAGRDIVEELTAGDFQCNEIVSFFFTLDIAKAPPCGEQCQVTIDIDVLLTAQSRAAPGAGFVAIERAVPQYEPTSNGAGFDAAGNCAGRGNPAIRGLDCGVSDNGDSTVEILGQEPIPAGTVPLDFSCCNPGISSCSACASSEIASTLRISNLSFGEKLVVRLDVRLACAPQANPRGTLNIRVPPGGTRIYSQTVNGQETILSPHVPVTGGNAMFIIMRNAELLGNGAPPPSTTTIVQTAPPTTAPSGDMVFNFTLRNTGRMPIGNLFVMRDCDLIEPPLQGVVLQPGESIDLVCTVFAT